MVDVAIIDYNLGNLHSVYSACKHVGLDAQITSDSKVILNSRSSILPGVGAFGEAMQNIKSLDLNDTILEYVSSGRPFFGICLGMQLLFDKSEEFGSNKGLGLIKGKAQKFNNMNTSENNYPVPQIGWNKIYHDQDWSDTLFSNINKNDYMYFVHSYYVVPENNDCVLSYTTYGDKEYCSAISSKNIFATQFHPEKSGEVGLNIYRKFKSIL